MTSAVPYRLASAIVARDYASAYACVASERQASVSLAEFEEAFRHYRDALPDALQTTVSVDPYDREAGLLVPDELRDRIVAEGAVEFDPGGRGAGGLLGERLDAAAPIRAQGTLSRSSTWSTSARRLIR